MIAKIPDMDSPPKLLRLPAVLELTGLGRSTLYVLMRRGEFPSPVRISVRAVAWRQFEVVDWINSRTQSPGQPGCA